MTKRRMSIFEVEAALLAIDDACSQPAYKKLACKVATAGTADPMVTKMEALRQSFIQQAEQTKYEAQQRLANLLREMNHCLTELIHSMSVVGEDPKQMQKLQSQVTDVTKKMVFLDGMGNPQVGFTPNKSELSDNTPSNTEDDKELAKPTTNVEFDLGGDKTSNDANEAFRLAVLGLIPKKEEPKQDDAKKDDTKKDEAKKDDTKKDDTKKDEAKKDETKKNDNKESKEDTKKEDKKGKNKDKDKDKDKDKAKEKEGKKKDSGFVDGLLAESSDKNPTLSRRRVIYVGPTFKKIHGVRTPVVQFFVTQDGEASRIFVEATSNFLGANAKRLDKLVRKIMQEIPGYDSVITSLEENDDVNIYRKPCDEVDRSYPYWYFVGIKRIPDTEDKSICIEINDCRYYLSAPELSETRTKILKILETEAYYAGLEKILGMIGTELTVIKKVKQF